MRHRKPDWSKVQPGDTLLFGRRALTHSFPRSLSEWRSYFVQRGIQRSSGSIWNHVGIIVDTKVPSLLEATYPDVGVHPLIISKKGDSSYGKAVLNVKRYEWAIMRPCTWPPQGFSKALAWANEEAIGDRYDVSLIAAMAKASREDGISGLHKLRVDTFGDAYWICSELVITFYYMAGIVLMDEFDPDVEDLGHVVVPTPGDLFKCGRLVVVDSSF